MIRLPVWSFARHNVEFGVIEIMIRLPVWSFARHNVEFGVIEQRQVNLLWGSGNKSPDWGGAVCPQGEPAQ
jgi:hypothetical protein